MYHNIHTFAKNLKTKTMELYQETKQKANSGFLTSTTRGDRRFYALVLLALESGARVSDLLSVNQSNFTVENEEVYITYLNKKSNKVQPQRISNLTYKKIKILIEDSPNGYVFYNPDKKSMLSRITANRKCKSIFGFNFHNLRKLAGKNIANQKGIIYASKYLGHSRVSVTDIYLDISKEQFKKDMQDCII